MPLTGDSPDGDGRAAAGAGGEEEERPWNPLGPGGVARVGAAWDGGEAGVRSPPPPLGAVVLAGLEAEVVLDPGRGVGLGMADHGRDEMGLGCWRRLSRLATRSR